MSLVYILMEDGQHASHEESEVEDLLARGIITPQTFFWKEGMADWRPLAELVSRDGGSFVPPRRTANTFSNSETPAKTFQTAEIQTQPVSSEPTTARRTPASGLDEKSTVSRKSSKRYRLRYNLMPLTVSLQILFAGSICATAFLIYQCVDKIQNGSVAAFPDPMTVLSGATAATNAGISAGDKTYLLYFAGALLGVHVVTAVLFYFWIFYANKNCRGMASNMIYTPGQSVASFLIPAINLFRPYKVVQELWKVSNNPQGWFGRRNSIFVGFWFLVRLSYLILLKVVADAFYGNSDDSSGITIKMLTSLSAFEAGIILIELATFILISFITWWQVGWAREAAALQPDSTRIKLRRS
jgi:hypothetical protein